VMQSLDRMGWYPYVATALSVGDPSVIEATPAGLKGKIAGGGIAAGQVENSGKPAGELSKQFFDEYSKVHKVTEFSALDTVGSYTFDWAVVLNAAIKATGTTDDTKLRDWLIGGNTVQGAQGPLKFGDEGTARIGISLDDTTVFDPSQPCKEGLCQAVRTD
jgi:ABC-type branched-subunit amino acid transport system substrate-binding protein